MLSLSFYLPGFIVAFREGLEAFLIIIILLRFLEKMGYSSLKKNIWIGGGIGILISFLIGGLFFWMSHFLDTSEGIGKIWESSLSLIAVCLIISFVIWMIRNGQHIKKHIEQEANSHLSPFGILFISSVCIAREGVEISVFAYAGEYPWQGILLGIFFAILLAVSIYTFSIRTKFTTLFTLTLFYLIIQCGYLLGYSIHEGLSSLQELKILPSENWVYIKAFDVSQSLFNHKQGILGLPLNILFGWHSKPEWIQFIAQYLCTGTLFLIWRNVTIKR